MRVERSVGAVVFRKTPRGVNYLLLHHYPAKYSRRPNAPDGHWDFPKGHIENGERSLDTLKREVKEETGISGLKIIPNFKKTIKYFVGPERERRLKFVAYFLAETKTKKIKISFEHQGFAWLLFTEAARQITYANSKNILKSANKFLKIRA